MEISKEDFESYEDVRQSGITNMFAVSTVEQLSGLSREKILKIMKNYNLYMEKWPEVRNNVIEEEEDDEVEDEDE